MDTDYHQTRTDFRCLLCRRKNAFHCEHDTPYRDRYLGTYTDPSQNHNHHRRKSKNENSIHSNSINTGGNTERQQFSSKDSGIRYQQYQTVHTGTNNYPKGSSKTFVKEKKSKSCVIL